MPSSRADPEAVYVVLVTFNSLRWLDRCLSATLAEFGADRVICVDNASRDGTADHLRTRYPSVTILPQQANLGFGGANNLGIVEALRRGATHVFLLNHDAWPLPGMLPALLASSRTHPAAGILSPVHVQADGHTLDPLFRMYSRQAGIDPARLAAGSGGEVHRVPFVNAAGWLLPRDTLFEVGGFSPLFFHYGEDRDLAGRVRYHGFDLLVVPSARMVHDRGGRPVGWALDPAQQRRVLGTGLRTRLTDPRGGAAGRLGAAARWTAANLYDAARVRDWAAFPAAGRAVAEAWRERARRAAVRAQVRERGPHFLDVREGEGR